jgi:hypothetical protein
VPESANETFHGSRYRNWPYTIFVNRPTNRRLVALELAHAREQALAAWGGAQNEADRIMAALPWQARGDPNCEENSGYAAAYERSVRRLDPVIEIEDRLEQITATTVAGLLIQARLLQAALASSNHGGGCLLASIIGGWRG